MNSINFHQFFMMGHGKFDTWLSFAVGSWLPETFHQSGFQYETTTVFGAALHAVSILVCIIIGLIIFYFVVLKALDASAEGETLSPKASFVYAIRLVVVLALTAPIPLGKYGTVPVISRLVAELAVVGSNVADWLYDASIDDFIAVPDITSPMVNGPTTAKNTLQNMVCAISANATNSSQPFAVIKHFDSWGKTTISSPGPINNLAGVSEIDWAGGACGITSFNKVKVNNTRSTFGKNYLTQIQKQGLNGIQSAYSELTENLYPIAKTINQTSGLALSKVDPGATPADNKDLKTLEQQSNNFHSAVENYTKEIQGISDKINNSNISDQVKDQMKNDGWIGAGIWMLSLSNYQTILDQIIQSQSVSTKTPEVCGIENHIIFSDTCIDKYYLTDINDGVAAVYDNSLQLFNQNEISTSSTQANISQECNLTSCSVDGVEKSYSALIASHFISLVSFLGGDDNQPDNNKILTNPVWKLSSLGHGYLRIGSFLYGLKLAFATLSGVVKGANGSILGKALSIGTLGGSAVLASTISTLLNEIIKSVGLTETAMMINGYMLAYGIPLLPSIIWIFIVISYIGVVLEAMLIAPLALCNALMPEGSGISGLNMQRFKGVMVNVLIRPFLYVSGFLLVYILLMVGYTILNYIFWKYAQTQVSFSVFGIVSLVSTYTIVCLLFVTKVLNLMVKIPESAIRVLTGGVTPALSLGDPTPSINSAISSTAQSTRVLTDTSSLQKKLVNKNDE